MPARTISTRAANSLGSRTDGHLVVPATTFLIKRSCQIAGVRGKYTCDMRSNNALKLASLVLILGAPLLMAPGSVPCPDCSILKKWSGSLAPHANTTGVAPVSGGVLYRIELVPSAAGVALEVIGNREKLSCSSEGKNTICQFRAQNNGTVDLRITAGSEAAKYRMYQTH